MDVAREVAELLQTTDAGRKVALLCKPDGADSVCAYGILKILFFHCCRDVEAYTDCTSLEILRHNMEAALKKGVKILFLINCYYDKARAATESRFLAAEAKVIVLDCRHGRKKSPHPENCPFYFLGGTEEEVLRRVYERDLRMRLPCYKYHGTPASLCAYHICTSMNPSFRHPNALWRAVVGTADVFQRRLMHPDQYTHIHDYFISEASPLTLCKEMLSVDLEEHETCLSFFQQSSLWDALHMSPHLYETFDESGFQDFIANTLGFPQNIAEYSYYQFVTGPGNEIWEKLRSAGNLVGVQDLVISGFMRSLNGFVVHSMDHALAVNSMASSKGALFDRVLFRVALWHWRSKQYQQETICVHDIFRSGEEVMGNPQEMIPRYVEILKTDCDTKRKKVRKESLE